MKSISRHFITQAIGACLLSTLLFGFLVSSASANTPANTAITNLLQQVESLREQLSLTTTYGSNVVGTNSVNVGDRVATTDDVNVRVAPGMFNAIVKLQPAGSQGTVIGGPALPGTPVGTIVPQTTPDKNSWWQVKWDNGVEGWSSAIYIRDLSSDYGGVTSGTAVTCDSFKFTPSTVSKGQSTTASWVASNGGKVVLMNAQDDFEKELKTENTYTFVPEGTGTYTIKVIGSNNTQATCVATVVVRGTTVAGAPAPMQCEYFNFSPSNVKKGAEVTLAWKVNGAASADLTNTLNDDVESFDTEDALTFDAEKFVTYFLTGIDSAGKRKVLCSASLVVQSVSSTATTPICNSFTHSPRPPQKDEEITLKWDTTNAVRAIITSTGYGVEKSVPVDGSYKVIAKHAALFTLTATGSDGTRSSCTTFVVPG